MLTIKTPHQSGYGLGMPGAIATQIAVPQSFSRKDIERNTVPVTVSWALTDYGYQYIRSFFRGVLAKGNKPFQVELIVQNSQLDIYTAFFQQGSFRLASLVGCTFIVQATLDVVPNYTDPAYDTSLLAVYQAFEDDAAKALNLFSVIVNVNWPV